MKTKTPTTIGERLRAARVARGLTHEALARAAGLSTNHVQTLQSGRRQPNVDTLAALCRALRISADELLGLR
jgi:transcriptional regulator with XRE-family HTH domain